MTLAELCGSTAGQNAPSLETTNVRLCQMTPACIFGRTATAAIAGQTAGAREVEDQVWLVIMLNDDPGYFDNERGRVEPGPIRGGVIVVAHHQFFPGPPVPRRVTGISRRFRESGLNSPAEVGWVAEVRSLAPNSQIGHSSPSGSAIDLRRRPARKYQSPR